MDAIDRLARSDQNGYLLMLFQSLNFVKEQGVAIKPQLGQTMLPGVLRDRQAITPQNPPETANLTQPHAERGSACLDCEDLNLPIAR